MLKPFTHTYYGVEVTFTPIAGHGCYIAPLQFSAKYLAIMAPMFADGSPDIANIGEVEDWSDTGLLKEYAEQLLGVTFVGSGPPHKMPPKHGGTNMRYSTEMSGNWIWEPDDTMDDGMRAVVQIPETSPLFNYDGSWNRGKLMELSQLLRNLAGR